MTAEAFYEYSGVLRVPDIATKRARIEELASRRVVALDFYDGLLEIRYAGRDHGRRIRTFLFELASIIGDADGEIAVEIDRGNRDPELEFYSIHAWSLRLQRGRVVRGEWETVEPTREDGSA